jgi:hypothetical protein
MLDTMPVCGRLTIQCGLARPNQHKRKTLPALIHFLTCRLRFKASCLGMAAFGTSMFRMLFSNRGRRFVNVTSDEKGPTVSPAPCLLRLRSGSLQRAPAAAAKAGAPTFTLICFGFASSRFGMLRVNTPFL